MAFFFYLHFQKHTLQLFHLWKTISVFDENVRLTKCLYNNRKSADETEQLEQQPCLLEIMPGSSLQQQIRSEMKVVKAKDEVQRIGFVWQNITKHLFAAAQSQRRGFE